MPPTPLRSITTLHFLAGDTAERHADRLSMMATNSARIARTVRLVTVLHKQLGVMSRSEANSCGSRNGWPRMNLRQIGNQIHAPARGWHCHAGIYRTRGAHDVLTAGSLSLAGNAVVHCEHTIPSSLLVDHMWRQRQSGKLALPGDMLAWILANSVITVALQSERKAKGSEPVALSRQREICGSLSSWSYTHPDIGRDDEMLDETRPFVRYFGTGADIVHVPTNESVDLRSTMADHRARIANCAVHSPETYGMPRSDS